MMPDALLVLLAKETATSFSLEGDGYNLETTKLTKSRNSSSILFYFPTPMAQA